MTFKNIQFKCIKGIPINSVETRMLGEIGFPVDVPTQPDMSHSIAFHNYVSKISEYPFPLLRFVEKYYIKSLIETKSKDEAFKTTLDYLKLTNVVSEELEAALQSSCIFGLNALDAETLIEEFVFIIKELLPRQLSDIYYSFDIEPNPAYAIFFDLAIEKLSLKKCEDKDAPCYGQFIENTIEGIKQRFNSGETLISIYEKSCATKTLIKDTISSIPHNTYNTIELVLFSLSKQFYYTRTEDTAQYAADFVVYKDGEKILNIIFLSEEELDHIDDYKQYLSELYLDETPLLVLDHYELYSEYLSSVIRKAIKEPQYIEQHSAERVRCVKYEKAIRCSGFNYKFVKTAKICGCYSCGELFAPQDITDWHLYEDEEKGGYAYCPCCGEDTVIMDSQGYEITEKFMEDLYDYIVMRDNFDYY